MPTPSIDRPASLHCRGVITRHHAGWWLMEFPEPDAAPSAVHRLTGAFTPAMTAWVIEETGDIDTGTAGDVASLCLPSACWSGDFTLVRSGRSPGAFDIAAQSRGAPANDLEARLARTMIEGTLHPIPPGFLSVLSALPDENLPVLAIRLCGYHCATFELLTARYMPTYRPRSPWRTIANDAVTDSGGDILGWTQAGQDWIKPC